MYSYSKIQSFFQCPMKFKFRYVDKIKIEDFAGIEAFMGSRVHEALEKLYTDRKHEKVAKLDEIVNFYEAKWKENMTDAVKVIKEGYTKDNYFDMGRKYVTDYYRKYAPFDQGVTLGLEQKININVGGHPIVGFIDRLTLAQGSGPVYEIHDYKTGGFMPRNNDFQKDEQLALYAIAVTEMHKDAIPERIKLIWHYLAFNREIVSYRTSNELAAVKQNITQKIGEIECAVEEGNLPANESALCKWCEYQRMCPLHKHRFESQIAAVKKEDEKESAGKTKDKSNPLLGRELADKYVLLKQKEKEIADELERTKEELVDYSKKNGFSLLAATDFDVKVSETHSVGFPKAGDEERLKLERFLKEKGLWEKVSALDSRALAKFMKETLLDRKVYEKINGFAKDETSYRVALRKKAV